VLTKPLGTGIITTAGKQGTVSAEVLEGAVAVMSTLNRAASESMVEVGVNACTDVTGFGLVGHLSSMMRESSAGCRLRMSDIPVLPGARDLVEQGVAPGGTHRNLAGVGSHVRWHDEISQESRLLLCDAQTSGGLLISVAGDRVDRLLGEMEARGVAGPRVIGEVLDGGEQGIQVVP
jgi:selenide,water dikinase